MQHVHKQLINIIETSPTLMFKFVVYYLSAESASIKFITGRQEHSTEFCTVEDMGSALERQEAAKTVTYIITVVKGR